MEASRQLLLTDDVQHSLQELDEAIASVGDTSAYLSPRLRETEKISFNFPHKSKQSHHSVDRNRHHFDNMDTINKGFPMFASSCSKKSVASRSSRRSVSSRSTRRRGPSLERAISQTILKEASSNSTDDTRSYVERDVCSTATVDILKELCQAGAVLATEVLHDTNLLPTMQLEEVEPDLLSQSKIQDRLEDVGWRPDWDAVPDLTDSAEAISPRSRKSVYGAQQQEMSSSVVVAEPETFNTSGEAFEKTFFTNDTDPETQGSLFSEDPFGALVDGSGAPSAFPSREMLDSNYNDREWMSFGDNPFHEDDDLSLASPSSIADFDQIVDRLPTKSKSWNEFHTKFSI